MKFKKTLSVLTPIFFCSFMAACGVDHTDVEGHPPVIDNGISQFGSPLGVFKLDIASVFLWPAGLEGDDLSTLVAKVAVASNHSDTYGLQTVILKNEIEALENRWEAIDCDGNYAVLQPGQDEIDPGHISEWKPVSGQKDVDLLGECVRNQSARETKETEKNDAAKMATEYIKEISLALDPDQANVQNMKKLEATKSQLSVVEENGAIVVHVTLGDFLITGHSPTTDLSDADRADPKKVASLKITNASYDLKWRLLKFDVPEVDTSGEPTGRLYKFAVERTKDRGPMSRFTGEMNLTENGQILRHGMARFDAALPVPATAAVNH